MYSSHKIKIPNSFSATIFNRHRIQYESSSLDTEFSNVFFFLPSTTDRIEEINRYVNSVDLIPTDIDPSAFGKNFPSKLDFENENKQKTKDSVLKVLRKVVDFSNSSLQKNADGLLATKPHKDQDILWMAEVVNAYLKTYLLFLIKLKEQYAITS